MGNDKPKHDKGARYIARGAVAMLEFLGPSQQPVERSVAEARASLCRDCPMNRPARGWIDTISKAAANATKAYFRIKDDMKLEVSCERDLGICEACWCPIKLKVWMPIVHIEDNTSDEVMADLDERCWIPQEMEASR